MILLIDNYDSFTYNIFQAVAGLGFSVAVRRNDQIKANEIKTLMPKGIILSPGPGRPEGAGICLELIGKFSGKIPILGICLGHQAIASAFGGKVVGSGEIVHGKKGEVYHQKSGLYQGLPSPFMAGRYHSLVVEREPFPENLRIESQNGDRTIMGLSHREHPTFGVQFHPESVLSPGGPKIFENFLRICQKF